MKIEMADGLALPANAAVQVYAFMGRRGSGKTFAAGRLVEQVIAAGAQVVILDPVGTWWGLRLAADGKSPGLSIPVFGGLHGDIPLAATAGKVVAELAAERATSLVLDVSDFTGADQRRFVADFATEFFHAKKRNRSAVLVVMEEAQEFAPPEGERGQRAHGRGGRADDQAGAQLRHRDRAGFAAPPGREQGCPEPVGGDVLLSDDRAPGAEDDRGLGSGKGCRRTGHRRPVAEPTDRDGPDVVPPVAGSVREVQDPAKGHLRRQRYPGRRGEAEGGGARPDRPRPGQGRDGRHARGGQSQGPDRAPAGGGAAARRTGETTGGGRGGEDRGQGCHPRICRVSERGGPDGRGRCPAKPFGGGAGTEDASPGNLSRAFQVAGHGGHHRKRGSVTSARVDLVSRQYNAAAAALGSKSGERAILIAIAQHQGGVTREQLTVLTGYKRSTRDAYLQRLRGAGMIDQQGDQIVATAAGLGELGSDFEPLPTGADLREHWLRRLPEGERRVLEVVVDGHPRAVARDSITDVTGYKRSTRDAYLQRLASRRLVVAGGSGTVSASPELF